MERVFKIIMVVAVAVVVMGLIMMVTSPWAYEYRYEYEEYHGNGEYTKHEVYTPKINWDDKYGVSMPKYRITEGYSEWRDLREDDCDRRGDYDYE